MAAPVSKQRTIGSSVVGIGSPPAHLLTAATTPQDSVATLDNEVCRTKWGMQVNVTGSPSAVVVTLFLSIDGVNWMNVGTWSLSGQQSGDIVNFIDKPAIAAYVQLTTLTGGTNPTVDVWVCGQ